MLDTLSDYRLVDADCDFLRGGQEQTASTDKLDPDDWDWPPGTNP